MNNLWLASHFRFMMYLYRQLLVLYRTLLLPTANRVSVADPEYHSEARIFEVIGSTQWNGTIPRSIN